jgi:hypothetical protein
LLIHTLQLSQGVSSIGCRQYCWAFG